MPHLQLFTDGSVNTKLKIGYGACLVVTEKNASIDALRQSIKVKRFEETSSTKLELQTLLWTVNEAIALADQSELSLTVYTDSQNIIGLPARRTRLEQNNYYSANGKRLNNYLLYQEFYRLVSSVNIEWVKVVGHQISSKNDETDRLFALVDQAARQALREEF